MLQLSFAVVVYPSLLLTYLGQTSMIASRQAAAGSTSWEQCDGRMQLSVTACRQPGGVVW